MNSFYVVLTATLFLSYHVDCLYTINNDVDVAANILDSSDSSINVVNLEKIALLDGLNLENLNNKLSYFGLPQLDPSTTEIILKEYRITVGQVLQVVKFSKYIVPNIYDNLNIVSEGPLLRISKLLGQHGIQNVNCLIDNLSAGTRNALISITNATRASLRSHSPLDLPQGRSSFDTFIADLKELVKESLLVALSSIEFHVVSIIDRVNSGVVSWAPSQFVLDITGIFRFTLSELSNAIVATLEESKSRIEDILTSEESSPLEDLPQVFEDTLSSISNKVDEIFSSRLRIVTNHFNW